MVRVKSWSWSWPWNKKSRLGLDQKVLVLVLVLKNIEVLVLVLVLRPRVLVLVLVLRPRVLVLVLVLRPRVLVLVLVLVLRPRVLVLVLVLTKKSYLHHCPIQAYQHVKIHIRVETLCCITMKFLTCGKLSTSRNPSRTAPIISISGLIYQARVRTCNLRVRVTYLRFWTWNSDFRAALNAA